MAPLVARADARSQMLTFDSLKRARKAAVALTDRAPGFPSECRIGVLERQLTGHEGRPVDIEYLRRLFTRLEIAARHGDFTSITAKDWRHSIHVLWDGEPALVERPAIFDRLSSLITSASSAAPLRRLIFSYMSRFDLRRPSISAVGSLISSELKRRSSAKFSAWQRRDSEYNIFSPRTAIKAIPIQLVAASDILGFERELGIEGQLSQQGFIVHIWAAALMYLEARLKAGESPVPQLERVLDSLEVGKKLRFESLRTTTASALLSPWASRPPVTAQLQKRLKDFFLNHLGDPYTRRSNWHGVSADAVSVMRKWLAQENLRLFFELITQASDADDYATGHWKYRRHFWRAYWERGALDEAWMVLGSSIEKLAKEKLTQGIGYGRLKDGNKLHAVLLMRVGTLVFAEWSYNGKCRAWATDDKLCPQIGSLDYHTSDFQRLSMMIDSRYASDGISHINSEAGYWQGLLARFIRDRTRIQVTSREYMP